MKVSIEYLISLKERLETTYSVVEDDSIYNVNIALPFLEYESQLLAIVDLLIRQYEVDTKLEEEISRNCKITSESSEDNSEYSQILIDQRNELIQKSIFQEAAHSMSAIGMLAPFTESLFYHLINGLRSELFEYLEVIPPSKRLEGEGKKAWDCHYYLNENNKFEKNIVKGIMQLNGDLGLTRFMPENLEKFLQVLFKFRNAMFHCGFEWPVDEKSRFQNHIIKKNWPPDWISSSSINDEPWIFYLTENFIVSSIEIIVNSLLGMSKYIERILAKNTL